MKRYWKYIKPYLRDFILGPVLMITEVLGEILLPWLMSLIINYGIADRNTSFIITIGVIMVITACIMAVGGVGGAYFSCRASVCFTSDLRSDLFSKVQEFSFKNIDDYSTGSLVTRLTNDIQQVQNMVMMCLRQMFRSPGMLIGALIMALSINPRLTLVILVIIPFIVLTIVILLRIGMPRFTAMQERLDALNSMIQEALTNVRVIKSFVREDYEKKDFGEKNKNLRDRSIKAMKIPVIMMPAMTLAMDITTIAVVWYGGRMIIVGDMMIGDLTAFISYISQILMSLSMLSSIFLQASRAMASVKRINEVMNTEVDLTDDDARYKDLKVERGKVEFKNVSFSYDGNAEDSVIEDINFTIQPGQMVGIIGATGSGKTSLVQLIPRLYDATKGEVLVDDVDVRDYSLRNLRDGVGMVLQKNVLFCGTIEENLKWGDENASMEELREAALNAQADDFIMSFTDGYDTDLGQGGSNVSGGQKQRLCIARALLKKPKILILDDSTSAVDTATEARIRDSFNTTLKDTTKIIIAQRIGSVEGADMIIVMDGGRIIGMGSHEELIETCEAYQEIYYSQRDREAEVSA